LWVVRVWICLDVCFGRRRKGGREGGKEEKESERGVR
jgi:hypothetical protein